MNLYHQETPFKNLSSDTVKLFLVIAFLMLLAIASKQAFAADDESNQSISEEELTEIRSSPEYIKNIEPLFLTSCAYCHGVKGIGGKARKMQCLSLLKPDYVYGVITNGKKARFIMPSWKRSMDKEKRMQLTAYVMWLTDLPQCKK